MEKYEENTKQGRVENYKIELLEEILAELIKLNIATEKKKPEKKEGKMTVTKTKKKK